MLIEWNRSLLTETDAAFRLVGSEFRAHLESLGLVRLAEGNPIDWNTVLRPAQITQQGQFTWVGSDIYRFNDPLQATNPVFIQFWYGQENGGGWGHTVHNRFMWRFRVGTATNGAGEVVGNTSVLRSLPFLPGQTTIGVTDSSNLVNADVVASNAHIISGGANRLTFVKSINASFVNAQSPYMIESFLNIERTKDANGNDTPEGILLHTAALGLTSGGQKISFTNTSTRYSHVIPYGRPASRPCYEWGGLYIGDRATSLDNITLAYAPITPYLGMIPKNAPLGFLGCLDFDYEAGSNHILNVYGVNRPYRMIKLNAFHTLLGTFNASSRMLVLMD